MSQNLVLLSVCLDLLQMQLLTVPLSVENQHDNGCEEYATAHDENPLSADGQLLDAHPVFLVVVFSVDIQNLRLVVGIDDGVGQIDILFMVLQGLLV